MSRRRRFLRWALVIGGLLGLPRAAAADQDDVPVVLAAPEKLFAGHAGESGDWLTASSARVAIAGYPVGRFHTWHGRVSADVAVVEIAADTLYRMGLSMQTVADHRNDIAFRLVRLYYDATQLVEQRLGGGVLYAGLRHRCSHGADGVTMSGQQGRILIRSGPELGYRHQIRSGPWSLVTQAFMHGTMIGQNDDPAYKPRLLGAGALQGSFEHGSVSWFASAGLGAALVSGGDERTFGFGSPWRALSLQPLPAAALGLQVRGNAAELRLVLHYQRVIDTGFGQRGDPASLLAFEIGFAW